MATEDLQSKLQLVGTTDVMMSLAIGGEEDKMYAEFYFTHVYSDHEKIT